MTREIGSRHIPSQATSHDAFAHCRNLDVIWRFIRLFAVHGSYIVELKEQLQLKNNSRLMNSLLHCFHTFNENLTHGS